MTTRRIFFFASFLFLILPMLGFAQRLTVIDETSKSSGNKYVQKVYREKGNGHAILCFETSLSELKVISNANDSTWIEESEGAKRIYFDIDLSEHKTEVNGVTFITSAPGYRELILRTPDAEDYLLKTPNLMPAAYYYKVILPDKFPVTMTVEYISSKHNSYRGKDLSNPSAASWSITSRIKGVRVAYGGRYGFYCHYKWGDYKPCGHDIDDITIDCDVSQSQYLGLIRRSLVVGTRIGIINYKDVLPIYLYLGGGYGEYGRQWESPNQVLDNNYFYSDHIKGFNGDIGVSVIALDLFSLSFGADMVIGNGNITVDYQIGIGISINRKWFKNKTQN